MSKDFFVSSVGGDEAKYTIGQLIHAVLAIHNEADAKLFYDGYVEWIEVSPETDARYTSVQVARMNIGWCFGEGMSPDKVKMWREVCNAFHPVFGSMEAPVTPEEAISQGIKMGKGTGKKLTANNP